MSPNPWIAAPTAPGPWVDEHRCEGCGERYDEYVAGITFDAAAHRLRQAAKAAGDEGGGYRSRGPVLWVMRCMKLEDWYMRHFGCCPDEPVPF